MANESSEQMRSVKLIQLEETPGEDFDLEGSQLNQVEALMQIAQLSPYWRAAHATAEVSLHDSSESISTNVLTLFDTGSSAGNFVSSTFVNKHNLQARLLKINKKVKVANGSRVNILAKLMLQVSFLTESGIRSANLEFNVMEGLSMDLIIGLPAICNHFREVLAEMMGKVIFDNSEML